MDDGIIVMEMMEDVPLLLCRDRLLSVTGARFSLAEWDRREAIVARLGVRVAGTGSHARAVDCKITSLAVS